MLCLDEEDYEARDALLSLEGRTESSSALGFEFFLPKRNIFR